MTEGQTCPKCDGTHTVRQAFDSHPGGYFLWCCDCKMDLSESLPGGLHRTPDMTSNVYRSRDGRTWRAVRKGGSLVGYVQVIA